MADRALVDANVIVRLLLGEPRAQALRASALFERAARGELTLVLHPAVLAEVIYVLTSPRLAAQPRHAVADALRGLVGLEGVEVADLGPLLAALDRFAGGSIDWVDCLLLAEGPDVPTFTFDEAMIAAGGTPPPA
jgi:predicted nucleic acid-binding protein